ncbi:MAG: 1-acyl-sn-glycerol-3-phosphate acyltransferase [Nanoarchaeota archaeon]|nr:1-acyl-sn-glycerol-3-phosphate acyltransferase [Nanoarchaeota archaeon]
MVHIDETNLLARLNDDFKEAVIEKALKKWGRRAGDPEEVKRIIEGFHISYDAQVHTMMSATWDKAFPFVLGKTVDVTTSEADDKLKKLRGKKPVIFVPDHRSNFDAPVVNYFLNKKNLLPVNIAGANLRGDKADVLGKVNVFFYERRLEGLPRIYPVLMNMYLEAVLDSKNNMLMFIEGGRSYTGVLNQKLVEADVNSRKGVGSLVKHLHSDDVHIAPLSINYVWVGEDQELMKFFKEGEAMPKVDLIENCLQLQKRLAVYEDFKVYMRIGTPQPLSEYIQRSEKADVNRGTDALQLELVKSIAKERVHFSHQILSKAVLESGRVGLDETVYAVATDLQEREFILRNDEFYDSEGNIEVGKVLKVGKKRLTSRGIITDDFDIRDRSLIQFYANQCMYNENNS